MALPKLDAFTALTAGTSLHTYSANWVFSMGSFVGGAGGGFAVPNSAGAVSIAYWAFDVFADDQYAQCTVGAGVSGSTLGGPAVRVTAGGNGYIITATPGMDPLGYFSVVVAGVATDLCTFPCPAAGSVIKLTVVDNELTIYDDGVQVTLTRLSDSATEASHTDSTFTSGSAGIAGYNLDSAPAIDNFEGGNLGTSFRCQSQTGAVAKAMTTTGMSGTSFTMAGWFRRDAAEANNGSIIYAGTAASGIRAEMQTTGNGADVRMRHTGGFDGSDAVFTVADGEWFYVAIIVAAGNWSAYAWRDTASEDRTSLGSNTSTAITPDRIIIGGASSVSPNWYPAQGEYVHFRYWNAVKTVSALNAERLSETPVDLTSIVGSWPLTSASMNSDNSGNGNTLTITGVADVANGASYPLSIGGGEPVDVGLALFKRNIMFVNDVVIQY